MVRIWLVAVAILSLSVSALAQEKVDLQTLTSKEGRFSVLMPANPKEMKQEIPTAVGTIKVTMYLSDLGNQAYVVSFNDYPADLVKMTEPAKMLESARGGVVGKGKLVSEKKITLDKSPGLDFEYELPDGKGIGRARMYLVNERLYQMLFINGTEKTVPKEVEKVLESFKLTK